MSKKQTTKRPLTPKAAEFTPCLGKNGETEHTLSDATSKSYWKCSKLPGLSENNSRQFRILRDAQIIEFLRQFVPGKEYNMVAQSAGCSYKDIVPNLGDRYGQPAVVAAACIEKMVVGPKLGNR